MGLKIETKISLDKRDDNVVKTFANQKLRFDVSKVERLFYQSVLFFKYIDWSRMSFPKTFRATVPAFHLQILVSKLICFQKHMRGNNNFGRACRFYFDYFHISVHSFIRDRKQLLMGGGRRGEVGFLCHPPFPNLFFLPS